METTFAGNVELDRKKPVKISRAGNRKYSQKFDFHSAEAESGVEVLDELPNEEHDERKSMKQPVPGSDLDETWSAIDEEKTKRMNSSNYNEENDMKESLVLDESTRKTSRKKRNSLSLDADAAFASCTTSSDRIMIHGAPASSGEATKRGSLRRRTSNEGHPESLSRRRSSSAWVHSDTRKIRTLHVFMVLTDMLSERRGCSESGSNNTGH